MLLRASSAWIALMIVAIVNGYFREAVLLPRLGATEAHIVSTISLCVLVLSMSWAVIPWIAPRSVVDALQIGAIWLAATLVFEFGFGRLVAKTSWSELFADYDMSAGRIWPLVLVTTFAAPLIAARIRALI